MGFLICQPCREGRVLSSEQDARGVYVHEARREGTVRKHHAPWPATAHERTNRQLPQRQAQIGRQGVDQESASSCEHGQTGWNENKAPLLR